MAKIIAKINTTLHQKLPTGLFLAAALLEVEADGRRFRLWNGGIPDVIQSDGDGALRRRIPSTDLPLGVVPSERLKLDIQCFTAAPGDHLYLYSDGLTEAHDREEALFGDERLLACFGAGPGGPARFERIRAALHGFLDGRAQSDDITLAELRLGPSGDR